MRLLLAMAILAATFFLTADGPRRTWAQGDRGNAETVRDAAEPGDDEKAGELEVPKGFREMRVRSVDSQGHPVSRTRIYVAIWPDGDFERRKTDYLTDVDGQALVLVPDPPRLFRVWTQKSGYVPLFAQWWPKRQLDGHMIPDEFTFKLPTGTKIGGVVENDAGQPIKGAIVEVMLVSRADELGRRPIPSIWLAEVPGPGENLCITDAEGRWSLNNVPAGDDIQVRLKLTHPQYISDPSWGFLQEKQFVAMKSLREQTAKIAMQAGPVMTGRVTDPDGDPVADAVIVFGDDPYLQTGSQEVRTNANGVYRLPPLRPGPTTITVVARGWRPEIRRVEIRRQAPAESFQLREGNVLQIRFVDGDGQAIPEVEIGIRQWRGKRSLYNHRHPAVLDTQIPRRADRKGIYQWLWAPEDEVQYSFHAEGFSERRMSLTGDDTVHTVTLRREE